jgi:hypothetical protein
LGQDDGDVPERTVDPEPVEEEREFPLLRDDRVSERWTSAAQAARARGSDASMLRGVLNLYALWVF